MINKLKLLKNIYFNKSPVSLILFLTNRCNARCPFCFIDFGNETTQNKDNELTADNYLSIAKNLKDSVTHLNITGGEPFLRSDIGEIVENFINYCDLNSIIFSTNGSYPKKISSFNINISKDNNFCGNIEMLCIIKSNLLSIKNIRTLNSFLLITNNKNQALNNMNLEIERMRKRINKDHLKNK